MFSLRIRRNTAKVVGPRYIVGALYGQSKKVNTLESMDSLTMACVAFDEAVMADNHDMVERVETSDTTYVLLDTSNNTMVKIHQF